jgi:hypothetical protein
MRHDPRETQEGDAEHNRMSSLKVVPSRVRFRDDVKGQRRGEETTFDAFRDAPAIFLLGEPAIGKTTMFRDLGGPAASQFKSSRLIGVRRAPDPSFSMPWTNNVS